MRSQQVPIALKPLRATWGNFARIFARRPFASRGGLFRGHHYSAALIASLITFQVIAAYGLGSWAFGTGWADVFGLFQSKATVATWLLVPLLWIGSATLAITRRRIDRPSRTLLRWLRFRLDWLTRGALIIAAYPTMATSFSIIKSSIPRTIGFYADPYLVWIDQSLLGSDVWRLTHAIMPNFFIFAIDRVYILWFSYMALITGVFSFTRDVRFQMRSALSFFLCWVLLGIFMATALASVGPVLYDSVYHSNHFAELGAALARADRERGLVAMNALEYLIKNAKTPKLGVGISAMPSMHVSIAFLGFLMALHYRRKTWLHVVTGLFTAAILAGSVHLGWHYLSDGLVSLTLTWLIWMAAGGFVDRSYRAPPWSHSNSDSLELLETGQTILRPSPSA